MLGRIRASSSSLESLEEERYEPSKITKHDSLSIYEATLVKLRQGAKRELTSITEQEMKTDTDPDFAGRQPRKEVMVIDTHHSPSSVLSIPTDWPLNYNTTTVVSMFNRYRTSHCSSKTPDQRVTD